MKKLLMIVCLLATGVVAAAELTAEKTVMVTGANRGIGLGFVEHYVDKGWNVIATARKPEAATDLQAIAAEYPNLAIVQLDVTDHARIDELAAEYADQPVDVLINNAGIKPGPMSQMVDFDAARYMFEVNVFGAYKVAEAFMPNLKASQDKKLVNISSVVGSIGNGPPMGAVHNYRASKAALNSYMVTLSHGVKKDGVIVTLFHPGSVNVSPDAPCVGGVPSNNGRPPSICVQESIDGMMPTIDALAIEDTGKFLNVTGGEEIPW